MTERKKFLSLVLVFLFAYWMPFTHPRVQMGILEAFLMLREYAREHVLLCLVPAFFIAGGIAVFISQAAVVKYFGAEAKKILSYGVASVSGTILAVCSCTVLPLFASIYQRGAGIGPAVAFLYSGPAINVLAIILTARVLGLEMGLARAVGAIIFAIVIGLSMAGIYRREEAERQRGPLQMPEAEMPRRLWQDMVFFALMVIFLVFANWGKPAQNEGFWAAVYAIRFYIAGASLILLLPVIWRWFPKEELKEWVGETYSYALMILPLLFIGVMFAGFFLGRPTHEAVIPSKYVEAIVGDSPAQFFALTGMQQGAAHSMIASIWPVWTCFFASISAAFMYFATLTEVPILQSLMGSGMGKGPALALLLAGPAVSLPNMLVIRGILGTRKTVTYLVIVVAFSTFCGLVYGWLFV
ncbi:MAG TPA: permease [Desulfosalsimonadaceae bacterium]|nr:permease [Desulfosalsimonadaceae bacterium]